MSTETKTLTNADAKIQPKLGVKALVQIGMLSAIAIILMMFEIPLPFAPTFYKIDLSEVPVLVGCFAMGPMAGVLVELVKILLNFVMTGTSTAGVGEIANFIIGCSFPVCKTEKACNEVKSVSINNNLSADFTEFIISELCLYAI